MRRLRVRYESTRIPVDRGARLRHPSRVYEVFRDLAQEPVEVGRAVFLESDLSLVAYEDVARGSVDRMTVHPREVFFSAVHLRAYAVIFLHNHPKGCPRPSRSDLEMTRRLKRCGDLLGIRLLDHIIVGDAEYYSFSENGLIPSQEGPEFEDPPMSSPVPLPACALVQEAPVGVLDRGG